MSDLGAEIAQTTVTTGADLTTKIVEAVLKMIDRLFSRDYNKQIVELEAKKIKHELKCDKQKLKCDKQIQNLEIKRALHELKNSEKSSQNPNKYGRGNLDASASQEQPSDYGDYDDHDFGEHYEEPHERYLNFLASQEQPSDYGDYDDHVFEDYDDQPNPYLENNASEGKTSQNPSNSTKFNSLDDAKKAIEKKREEAKTRVNEPSRVTPTRKINDGRESR